MRPPENEVREEAILKPSFSAPRSALLINNIAHAVTWGMMDVHDMMPVHCPLPNAHPVPTVDSSESGK